MRPLSSTIAAATRTITRRVGFAAVQQVCTRGPIKMTSLKAGCSQSGREVVDDPVATEAVKVTGARLVPDFSAQFRRDHLADGVLTIAWFWLTRLIRRRLGFMLRSIAASIA